MSDNPSAAITICVICIAHAAQWQGGIGGYSLRVGGTRGTYGLYLVSEQSPHEISPRRTFLYLAYR